MDSQEFETLLQRDGAWSVQFDSDEGARLLIEPAQAYALLRYIKDIEEIGETLDAGVDEFATILTERNAEIDALRDAHARIVARCMEWTQHVRIGKGGVCRTDEIARFVDEIRGIAGQSLVAAAKGER